MRKLALLFLIVFLGGLFFPLVSLAGFYQAGDQGVCYDGLVPCGKEVCVGAFDKNSCRDLLKEVQRRVEEEDESPNEAFKEICGATRLKKIRCQFCHFFVMLDGIIDFVLVYIVIPVAVLMLVVGGIMFMLAMFGGAELLPGSIKGGPKLLSQAKSLITSVIIGLVIIFASYLIVGVVLAAMGLADTNPIKDWFTGNSFTINCPIELQAAGNGDGNGENGENGEEEEEEEEVPPEELCHDTDALADYYNVPHSAQRSTDLQNFLTCLESRTMQTLPSEGAGNDFYGSVFTYDHDHKICNYTRGYTDCSDKCSHTENSCHYGGKTGTTGALAVDFGNELNIIPIRDAANQCCQDIWGEYCFILFEGDPPLQHIHISIPPCDRN